MTVATAERSFTLANNQTWEDDFTLVVAGVGDIIAQSVIHLMLRESADSPVIALHATRENGRILIKDPQAGIVTLLVPAREMRSLKPGAYVYDLIVERPTGRTYRLFDGTVTLVQGVTELSVTTPA